MQLISRKKKPIEKLDEKNTTNAYNENDNVHLVILHSTMEKELNSLALSSSKVHGATERVKKKKDPSLFRPLC
jgi:hypothetical protein